MNPPILYVVFSATKYVAVACPYGQAVNSSSYRAKINVLYNATSFILY